MSRLPSVSWLAPLTRGRARYRAWLRRDTAPAAVAAAGLAFATAFVVAMAAAPILPTTAHQLLAFQATLVLATLGGARLLTRRWLALLALAPAGETLEQWLKRLPAALAVLFAIAGGLLAVALMLHQHALMADLAPAARILKSEHGGLALVAIGVGAPVAEELLFRGLLVAAVAPTRMGFTGAALVANVLWTALHAGYSVYGLAEVFALGLYLSWLLWRSGSLWLPIACHAIYNTTVALAVLWLPLPLPA